MSLERELLGLVTMKSTKKAAFIGLLTLLILDAIFFLTSGVDTYSPVMFYIVWWPVAWIFPFIKGFLNTHEQFAVPAGVVLFTAGQVIDFAIYTSAADWLLKRRLNRQSPTAAS